MKNSADRGGCYPTRPKAKVHSSLRDLQNSSYPKKAEFKNCLLFIQNNSKFEIKLKHANLGRCKFISIVHLYQEV